MKKAKILNYTVKIYPAEEGGFWAKVPALPGCHTQGKTMEEVVAMIKEAINLHIKVMIKLGESIPIERIPTKNSSIILPIMLPTRA